MDQLLQKTTTLVGKKIFRRQSEFGVSDHIRIIKIWDRSLSTSPGWDFTTRCWFSPQYLVSLSFSTDSSQWRTKLGTTLGELTSSVEVWGVNALPGRGEVCHNETVGTRLMCPECPKYCEFRQLSKSCDLYNVSYLFDNGTTVIFAFVMSVWGESSFSLWCSPHSTNSAAATLFVELWKRRQAVLAWEWDLEMDDQEEQTRPEFEAEVQTRRINPVTKFPEPYIPGWNKFGRVAFTNAFVAFLVSWGWTSIFWNNNVIIQLLVVIFTLFAIIMFRITLLNFVYRWQSSCQADALMRNVSRESFKENQEKQTVLFAQARLLSSLVAATLNLLVIVLLNKLYEYVALWLVNWEQPRTQTEFEHSYTFKMFLFQFINFYLPLIYIALFKVSIRFPPLTSFR